MMLTVSFILVNLPGLDFLIFILQAVYQFHL